MPLCYTTLRTRECTHPSTHTCSPTTSHQRFHGCALSWLSTYLLLPMPRQLLCSQQEAPHMLLLMTRIAALLPPSPLVTHRHSASDAATRCANAGSLMLRAQHMIWCHTGSSPGACTGDTTQTNADPDQATTTNCRPRVMHMHMQCGVILVTIACT